MLFFFAFEEQYDAKKASIYAYIETPKGIKGGWVGAPQISVKGPYGPKEKRHYLQKAWYTVATNLDKERREHYFICHEEVFDRKNKHQDVLIKINIPRSERLQILDQLDSSNINHYNLIQSEESLIKSLAFKEDKGSKIRGQVCSWLI